jgi:pimeloyl-ACP methyl ester carboxylesterase
MIPFQQGRFEELPQKPHRPHAFFETEPIDLTLESLPFGRMRVHVRKHGSGPPLFLLHGLMTSSYSWRYVFRPLGEHFTCYAPDLPGAGRSDGPLAPVYSPENLATWIREVMDALTIRGAPAIANSMGGYLALQAVLQTPELFSRLVVVHSPGVPDLRMRALRFACAVPGSQQLLLWMIARDPLRWAHKNVHYWDESLKSLEEAEEYGAPLRKEGRILWKYLSETMSTRYMDPIHRLLEQRKQEGARFPIPLLLLYAQKDPMVPPAHGRVFAHKIPDAELVWLAEASHFAHVDAVERFLPPVLRFLAS